MSARIWFLSEYYQSLLNGDFGKKMYTPQKRDNLMGINTDGCGGENRTVTDHFEEKNLSLTNRAGQTC